MADSPSTVNTQLGELKQELDDARDEAELNLLQLQQVQEELKFYFLAHQNQQTLLQRYQQEQQRAEALIAELLEQLESRR